MVFRLWRKAIKITLREKKIFVIFTGIYTILIFLTSFFIETTLSAGGGFLSNYFIMIFFVTSLILSLLYSWLIVSRNRRIFATLKCIGWENSNINSLVTGIILFTTISGFIIVIEGLFHYVAIMGYLQSIGMLTTYPPILISLTPVVITFGMFLFVQIIAIILANRKILKVRPVQALKRVGG